MKRVFVVNPKAGSGIGPRRLQRLETFFRRRGGSFDVVLTSSREDVVARTRELLRAGAGQIVAVGGDGTLNAVANGFFDHGRPVRPDASLAVARMGSGSDYFRGLADNGKCDWREIVLNPVVRPVDVAVVRRLGDSLAEPRYFLNLMGFGMSADVVRRKDRLPPWLPRSLRYLLPTLPNLFRARVARFSIVADETSLDCDAVAVFVAKGTYAGGGMRFGGGVTLDDGHLDITMVRPMSPWSMLIKTPKLYSGNFANDPAIEKLRASRLRIESDPPLPAECDGELHGSTGVEITILPRAIQVCFP
jgi:diacylglycerol kinase (ATP)